MGREGRARRREPEQSLLRPAVGLVAVGIGLPFLALLGMSVTDVGFGGGDATTAFVGLGNYGRVFADRALGESVVRSVVFGLASVGVQLAVGLGYAELLLALRGRPILVALVLIPSTLSAVTVALLWRLALHSQFGPIGFYAPFLGLAWLPELFSRPRLAFAGLIGIDTWQWAPLLGVLFFAMRHAQSRSPEEAARLDGAGPLVSYFTVTLPRLLPWIWLVLLLRFVEAFREFDKPYTLTSGGPGTATELSSLYLWRVAFRDWEFGYTAAATVIVYAALLIVVSGVARPALRASHHDA